MEEEAGQFYVSVAKPVDDRHPMVLEDLSCFGGGLASDEQESHFWTRIRLADQLPGGGWVHPPLDFDGDVGLGAGKAYKRVPTTTRAGFHGHGQPGDLSQNTECLRVKRPFKFH